MKDGRIEVLGQISPAALNDDPMFIDALATLVRERAERWLEEVRAA